MVRSNALSAPTPLLFPAICSQFFKCPWFAGCFEYCDARFAFSLINEREKQVSKHQIFPTIVFGALNSSFYDALKGRSRLRIYLRSAVLFNSFQIRSQPRVDSHEISAASHEIRGGLIFNDELQSNVLWREFRVPGFASGYEGTVQDTFNFFRESHL